MVRTKIGNHSLLRPLNSFLYSSSAARRKTDELPDQEVNLLKTNESEDFCEEVSEDDSQDETGGSMLAEIITR